MRKLFTTEIAKVLAVSVLPILAVYLPFLLKIKKVFFLDLDQSGIVQIIRNWDGPHYLIVAKSLYKIPIIKHLLFTDVSPAYYAAHLPMYPVFIRIVLPVFGIFFSGLFINLLFGFFSNLIFYALAKKYTKYPLFLTFVFTVFPARFWIVRSIVAPETVMIFFILVSFWFWEKRSYFVSSVSGMFAVLTKFQSTFIFPAYVASVIEEYIVKKYKPSFRVLWMFLIPLGFIALSFFYQYRFHDFFAFFHAESNNHLGLAFPFSVFNAKNAWTGTAWLEEVTFYFIALFTLIATLFTRKERVWFYFSLFYTIFLVLLPHRDIARYSFQLMPIFFLTFEHFFTSKPFRYGLVLGLPALYFYTLNYIMSNQAQIADWDHFIH